jgi:hypothetical protein
MVREISALSADNGKGGGVGIGRIILIWEKVVGFMVLHCRLCQGVHCRCHFADSCLGTVIEVGRNGNGSQDPDYGHYSNHLKERKTFFVLDHLKHILAKNIPIGHIFLTWNLLYDIPDYQASFIAFFVFFFVTIPRFQGRLCEIY